MYRVFVGAVLGVSERLVAACCAADGIGDIGNNGIVQKILIGVFIPVGRITSAQPLVEYLR
ncbi:hypothetical protein SPRA44_640157 [Serratia proteamaculans]|nr:hypothetical protein SPRA44_640157 [Serratia proteamaculans]